MLTNCHSLFRSYTPQGFLPCAFPSAHRLGMPDRDGQADGALEVGALHVAGDFSKGGVLPRVLEAFCAVLLKKLRLPVSARERIGVSQVHCRLLSACGNRHRRGNGSC